MKAVLIYFGRKGGGPVYSLEIAKKLNKQINLLCLISADAENLSAWINSGLKIKTFYTYNSKIKFLLSVFNLKKFLAIKRAINEFNPEVVYYPFFHLWLPIINLFIPKVPKVYTCHDPILHTGENNFIFDWWQDILIKSSSRIVILSKIFIDDLIKKGVKKEYIDVIPHGILDYYSKFNNLRNEKHDPTLLFFGRIVLYKGLNGLLAIFPEIKKSCPAARLLVVGQGDLRKYNDLIKQPGVVVVNEWIPDEEVAKYFGQADILVCPYQDASQSGAIPIAYSFALPVIATRVGGLEEQVDNTMTGLLVPADDGKALAEASIKLLTDSELRISLGKAGQVKAQKEWNWENIATKVLASLNKAVIFKI